MRTLTKFVLGASLALSLPATSYAQRAGAIEVGVFGRASKLADTLKLDAGFGGGARAGIFIFNNLLAELELSYADLNVDKAYWVYPGTIDSMKKVSHALWSYRLTYNAALSDKVKLLIGGGYAYDSYGRKRIVAPRGGGPQALVGLRFVATPRMSFRVEGTGSYVMPADKDTKPMGRATGVNLGIQAGISASFFTSPSAPKIQYDTVRVAGPVRRDTVYNTRIDTVRITPPAGSLPGTRGLPIVIGAINFAFAKSDITPEAKKILDAIASSLTETVNMSRTVTVTGNTDAIGTENSNTKLGQDRADQAKAYLVSKGVADSRIVARTAGEGDPLAPNTTDNGRATNRRVLIMLTN